MSESENLERRGFVKIVLAFLGAVMGSVIVADVLRSIGPVCRLCRLVVLTTTPSSSSALRVRWRRFRRASRASSSRIRPWPSACSGCTPY